MSGEGSIFLKGRRPRGSLEAGSPRLSLSLRIAPGRSSPIAVSELLLRARAMPRAGTEVGVEKGRWTRGSLLKHELMETAAGTRSAVDGILLGARTRGDRTTYTHGIPRFAHREQFLSPSHWREGKKKEKTRRKEKKKRERGQIDCCVCVVPSPRGVKVGWASFAPP